MILNIILTVILALISIVLLFLGSKLKGLRKALSIIFACLFLVLTIVLAVSSARQIIHLQEELKNEKKRVETTSLDLYGYEISGDKTGGTTHWLHSAVPRVREMVQAFYDKQYKQADSMCDNLISDYPFFAGAFFWKGAIAIADGKDAKCESLWTKAADLEPKNITYSLLYRDLGIIRMRMNKIEEAVDAFELALGVALTTDEMRAAEKEQGKRSFERVSTDECYFLIAKAYAQGGQSDSADFYKAKAIGENPEWKEKWNDTIQIVIP
jgi:tetratricopeptide (TPR) repeat protein